MNQEPQTEQVHTAVVRERRFLMRYPSKAGARVIRDTDLMRNGIDGKLKDLSSAGLGILLTVPLEVNEQIKVELHNDVQRIAKEVRGVIRHVTLQDDELYHIGVELFTRLTPLEVSLFRMGMPAKSASLE